MNEPLSAELTVAEPWQARVARGLDSLSRWSLWGIALFVMVVIPWFFGGMGPDGFWFTWWTGTACLVPLSAWAVSSILLRRWPPAGFWIALVCWGLLAVQILVSITNRCQVPQAPWVGRGFEVVPHNPYLPVTAFTGATMVEGRLLLSYGLLALSAFLVGFGRLQWRLLLWIFVGNVAVLALIGIPFKYSGDYLMLGVWRMNESYFYSVFIYHNHWCAYALLGLASVIGLGAEIKSTRVRVLLTLMGAVIVVSAPISVSRLGTLAFAGFLLLACLVWLRRHWQDRSRLFRKGLLYGSCGLFAISAVGLSVVYLNRSGPGSVGQRSWSYIIKSNPFALRISLVEDAVPMVAERPVFGWGYGAFGAAFRNYQRKETIILFNEGRETRYDHCHNDWMERLVELGFLGFSLMVLPVLWGIKRLIPVLSKIEASRYWIFLGLVALWVFASGDMAFVNRSVCGVAAILTGFVLNIRGLESGKS